MVLSGTGSDGALGIRAIKGEGGMLMVQAPETTDFDGMPRSAISTGLADYVLPPVEMADALISYTSHAFTESSAEAKAPEKGKASSLSTIFKLLQNHSGHDFSHYKPTSVFRRINRRMALLQIDGIEKYVEYVQKTEDELDALFRDLLIGVTKFFRDIEAFSTLEEAYSIAILLQEYMDTIQENYNLQVFATEIDEQSIAAAHSGIYPASIAADVCFCREGLLEKQSSGCR